MQFDIPDDVASTVQVTLREDLGDGDLTSILINDDSHTIASVVVRESAILCGMAWFNEVFHQVDPLVRVQWTVEEGDEIHATQTVCQLTGPARSILSGERSALNFLQTLSGTATATNHYVEAIADLPTRILDTRKTIPGLRNAQKYAVRVGGGMNHRIGLYDGILIKENHQYVAKSLDAIFRQLPDSEKRPGLVEVEIEHLDQLERAIDSGANRIMLDNFCVEDMTRAVEQTAGRVDLEASGNIDLDNIRQVAATGVNYISIGAITKNLRSIDFSMKFEDETTTSC